MSLSIILVAVLTILFFMWMSAKNKVSASYHRVDQAYLGLRQAQAKRISTVQQFSKLWQGSSIVENNIFDKISRLSNQLKSENITKAQRNGLHTKMDALLNEAKLKMIGKKSDLPESQGRLLIASINEVEEQLSAARRTYYAAVAAYNHSLESTILSIFGGSAEYAPVDPYHSQSMDTLELKDIREEELLEREDLDDKYFET